MSAPQFLQSPWLIWWLNVSLLSLSIRFWCKLNSRTVWSRILAFGLKLWPRVDGVSYSWVCKSNTSSFQRALGTGISSVSATYSSWESLFPVAVENHWKLSWEIVQNVMAGIILTLATVLCEISSHGQTLLGNDSKILENDTFATHDFHNVGKENVKPVA